jgi:hypothetical protein
MSFSVDGTKRAAAQIKLLKSNLKEAGESFRDIKTAVLVSNIRNKVPVSGADDEKDQIALKDSWSIVKRPGGPKNYIGEVNSNAPHAVSIDQGWSPGEWQIPGANERGVAWIPEDPSDYESSEDGGYYDEDTGKVVYGAVDVGYYKGAFYIQNSLRDTFQSGRHISDQTRRAIVKSGFKPGKGR